MRPSNTSLLHYSSVPADREKFGGHRPPLQFKTLVPRSSVRVQRSHRARLQGNRLKTRDADWNSFVWTNWRHFLFVLRIAAMTWRRCAFVIEIIADLI